MASNQYRIIYFRRTELNTAYFLKGSITGFQNIMEHNNFFPSFV